ncbi:MAG: hypothetical protein KF745_15225 [Phycisphaeraceae bacterium]|nr:hypothetical protein [Phycisphaeraceae bacterium]
MILFAALSVTLGSGGMLHGQTQPPAGSAQARLADELALLKSSSTEPGVRSAVARRLLASPDISSQKAVQAILDTPEPSEVQAFLLREIASLPSAPTWTGGFLSRLAEFGSAEQRLGAVAALASVRTRDSLRTLISLAAGNSPGASPATRDAAFVALARLTGRAEFGLDARRWQEWFAKIEFLTEFEWQRVLAEGLAEGADRVARDRETALVRLVEMTRTRFAELPTTGEARSAFLVALLRDEFARIRRVGVVLTNTELANARIPNVGATAIDLLRDPLPDLRRSAAELVDALQPPGAQEAITNALIIEREESPAAGLLVAARRFPAAVLRPAALRWLARPGSARKPAIDLVSILYDRGLLGGEEDTEAVLAVLRKMDPESIPPTGLRLLVVLGKSPDRELVAGLLRSASQTVRQAAADAMASRPETLESLIGAAKSDASLFRAAAGAVAAAGPTRREYDMIATLPAPSPDVRRDGLAAVAAAMGPGPALEIARREQDAALREAILARLETLATRAAPDGIQDSAAMAEAMLLLARTRLDMRQPAAALDALNAHTRLASADAGSKSLRCETLIALNRLDEAGLLDAPASAWLDGLERATTPGQAAAVAQAIRSRFADQLSPGEADRLATLEAKQQKP